MAVHQTYDHRPREGPVGVLQFVPENTAPKKISVIQFSMLDGVDMAKLAETPIINRELYKHPTKEPMEYGPLDPHMGTSNKKADCATCGEKLEGCPGHFGSIKLSLPVFHIGYAKAIQATLRMICKSCSKVLLDPATKKVMRRRVRNKLMDGNQRKDLQAKIIKLCQATPICPYCGDHNGDVKKIGPLKFVHKKFKLKASDIAKGEWEATFETAISYTPEISQHLKNCGEDMHPQHVRQLFSRVPPEDCELLGMSHKFSRPEWMVMSHLLVPPCAIRPSVMMDAQGGSNEDDLTMKLQEIIWVSELIGQDLEKGTPVTQIMDRWDVLQLQVALYINSEFPGIPLSVQTKKPIRGICQRLKGKQGRFRGNLSGKRVDFTSRTVISPDPNLRIDEVGVPVDVASTLTYPERVNKYNIESMRKLVINGPTTHPGALSIVHGSDGSRRLLKYGDRTKHASELHIGDIVERHLRDGDVVLFNRQPSLHRISIMAHRARVMPWKTFRFNECACTPYNADFDGDEMNLHLPQNEEARAEARTLLGVNLNLAVPKSGELLISATQDFLTASFIITFKDSFYTRSEFCQILAGCLDDDTFVEMPEPAILKPIALYTGKQIFTALLQPNKKEKVNANLELKLALFDGKGGSEPVMTPNDSYLYILNGYFVAGRLDKAALGGGKVTLFAHLLKYFSPSVAADRMSKVAKMCARFMGNQGFSIGISDVTPSPQLTQKKQVLVSTADAACAGFIAQFRNGELNMEAGASPEQTVESLLERTLSAVRDAAGKLCIDELSMAEKWNAPLMMAQCGSKGSKINIAQMIACVGQQTVSGSRVPNGFINRSLPHFELGAKDPAAKGFVQNSFFTGLTPTEFFFHTQGGREGLIDTAVKTAETGYMQRRLMKALEDLTVQYDGTVRSTGGNVVQFRYGDDGVEPTLTESDSAAFDLGSQWTHCVLTHIGGMTRCLRPFEIFRTVDIALNSREFQRFTDKFRQDVREFFDSFSLTASETGSAKPPGVINRLALLRKKLFLAGFQSENDTTPPALPDDLNLQPKLTVEERESLVDRLMGISKEALDMFFKRIISKMEEAQAEPGTAVGALAAQSIGEPCTQMTLKTFHFAGVASMNITQGVPRIREIINATKAISTPLIEVKLENPNSKDFAKAVKGRIESSTISDVCEYIKEVYEPGRCCILIKLDMERLANMKVRCSGHDVARAIILHKKLKLKPEQVSVADGGEKVVINPPESITKRGKEAQLKANVYFSLQFIKAQLPKIPVTGLTSIKRAVIQETKAATPGGPNSYAIFVEGNDVLGVMAQKGVKPDVTKSNHLLQIQSSLGIEAARRAIIDEILTTMRSHGVRVDPRHLNLLADCMTSKGEILGITRFGISKMNDSALMLASFEKTTDYLFDAGQRALAEKIAGVSECIIMGRPIPLGTGLFKLLHQSEFLTAKGVTLEGHKTIFERFRASKPSAQTQSTTEAVEATNALEAAH
jgi:DNA-directed RNA polymerase III subunit RPC1